VLEEKNGNYPGGIQINSNRDRGEQNEKEARGFFFGGIYSRIEELQDCP